jgi:uncharacterized protein (TIGR02246 family)
MDQLTATRHAERIRELNESWTDAVARRALDEMMTVYAPEAQELVPGQPAIVGREAIRAYYRGVLDELPRLRHFFDQQEITISEAGDLAVASGTYRVTPDADLPDDIVTGKVVGVWVYYEGDWRLQINISNSDDA